MQWAAGTVYRNENVRFDRAPSVKYNNYNTIAVCLFYAFIRYRH
jgi:hypothetical protein